MIVDPEKMSLEEDVTSVLPEIIYSWSCKAESKEMCFKKGQTEVGYLHLNNSVVFIHIWSK